ncbi:MAG: AAA family ATPase, partial [Bacillota bacterium]|nr:AAA family ATPase [Bacillota bacterium]
MRLITIKLENFQRFQQLEIRLDGHDAAIIGQNETGKSTIANAITWVLTDKPYTDEPGYTPKTIRGKDFVHYLDHSATLLCELETGKQVELKKTLRETWTKKRGSTTAEMTGHTTSYWIDDLPLAMKDYNSRIAELFGDPSTI